MLKAAIDSAPLTSGHGVRGVGFYTRNLIEALGDRVDAVDFRTADLTKYDVVHYPYFDLFSRTLPAREPTKSVVTVHDVIPLIYPDHYPPGIRGKINFSLQKKSLKNADAIITDTETSKKDICRFLEVEPDKVSVVYLAPRKIFRPIADNQLLTAVQKKFNLPKSFVLYVGDVNYNKNIPNLVKACKIAKLPLIIVGKQAKEIEKLDLSHPELSHLRNVDWSGVIRPGFVSDEDLAVIYNLATLYVQPSFYEGFGFPVLEAVSSGTPVVAARIQSLVEIADGAATFVDPQDPKDIAEGFKNPVKNPKLPRLYSWEKTAKETLGVYKRSLAKL
ncbi:MAG: Group 1 glycosyl transferase [Candidatus Woesebacteria bacterium GW2011_GWB1_45_5]|uniref:Group 1 glycosyl transferase n=1 Tax=Candidatus Woesebacteria bacterium GW2011_GWB1_45_5 TaxID=1618581 RepID=A0A0G1QN63_9BACT|nr:MAG: Group 1 glycosyl transferase [Candidatus Woesebacteria bacterium GW2011_GWB1_45_5]